MAGRLVISFALLAALAAPAPGALHEVTTRGYVTYAFLQDVEIGAPFTVRFVVDSQDLEPDPTYGLYQTGPATVTFPSFGLVSSGEPSFTLNLGEGTSPDRAMYTAFGIFLTNLAFDFPPATFTSDDFPLRLPLSSALRARLQVTAGTQFAYLGNVTSYETALIPELAAAPMTAALALLALLRSRKCGRLDVNARCVTLPQRHANDHAGQPRERQRRPRRMAERDEHQRQPHEPAEPCRDQPPYF